MVGPARTLFYQPENDTGIQLGLPPKYHNMGWGYAVIHGKSQSFTHSMISRLYEKKLRIRVNSAEV